MAKLLKNGENMRKFSTIYWAISSGITIALIIFSFMTPNEILSNVFILTVPIVMIPNFFIRNHTQKSLRELESIYINECDPFRYLELMEKNNKKNIQTRMSRYFYKIRRADFLCECGDFKEARRLLDELLESEEEFNNAILAYYYKVWISYFIEFGNFDRVEILLEQMQQLSVGLTNRTMIMFTNSMYFSCLSKYNVYTKRDLLNTEKYFANLVNSNAGKAYVVSGMYYLALIALHNGEIDKAKRRSKYVYENGNKLSYARKIIKVIEHLEKIETSN